MELLFLVVPGTDQLDLNEFFVQSDFNPLNFQSLTIIYSVVGCKDFPVHVPFLPYMDPFG